MLEEFYEKTIDIDTFNWYVLFSRIEKQWQLCSLLCEEGVHAFLPVMEYYRRDKKELDKKPMFPGYVFVRSEMNQEEFDRFLDSMEGRRWGFIRQLKDEGRAALTEEERDFFRTLLDETGEAKMSYGYLDGNGRAVITHGPLAGFEKLIKKTDRHNHLAYLSFDFFDHPIKVGLTIMTIKELKFRNLCDEDTRLEVSFGKRNRKSTGDTGKAVIYDEESDEDIEIDLKELISRMTQL
ncbi:MAG: transcription termination/antitermination NusG family protein [Clostridiales bacterium]|nr:transcription termination/antitermination NusG family protein [Clostridiales bacterium]